MKKPYTIFFFVPGKIQPWQRSGQDGKAHFRQTATDKYQKCIQNALWVKLNGRYPNVSKNTAVTVAVNAVYAPLKGWRKWKKEAAKTDYIPKITRPDGDNILKTVLDALNGIAYPDDGQVSIMTCHKLHHVVTPGLYINIRYEEQPANEAEYEAMKAAKEAKEARI